MCVCERGFLTRDENIARQSDLEPGSERVAVDRSDDRHWASLHLGDWIFREIFYSTLKHICGSCEVLKKDQSRFNVCVAGCLVSSVF